MNLFSMSVTKEFWGSKKYRCGRSSVHLLGTKHSRSVRVFVALESVDPYVKSHDSSCPYLVGRYKLIKWLSVNNSRCTSDPFETKKADREVTELR